MKDFDFLGFEASPQLRHEARRSLKRLLNFASGVVGSDAYIIKTRAGTYEGAVKIHTAWSTFSASAARGSAEAVLEYVSRQVHEQIAQWRRSRAPVLPTSRQWANEADWIPYSFEDDSPYHQAS